MILSCFIWLMSMLSPSIDARVKAQIESVVAQHAAPVHEIEYRTVPRELAQLDARAAVRIVDEPHALYRGMINLPVEVTTPAGKRTLYYVGLRVRTFETVAVAAKMIERHQLFDSSNIIRQKIETTQFAGEPVTMPLAELCTMRSRQIVGAGKALAAMMIEPLPLVVQGATVNVRVVMDNVRLTASGTARQDGWKGTIVAVDLASPKRQVRARVVDTMTVEVVE